MIYYALESQRATSVAKDVKDLKLSYHSAHV